MWSQILWTFWGKVGWLAVGLPAWIIYLLTIFGLSECSADWQSDAVWKEAFTHELWITTWLIATFTLLAVFRNGLTTFANPGRLLFRPWVR